MSNYLVTDTELTGVANAIRAKNKSQESLAFPTDFVSAIANLPSGGNIEEDGNGNLTFSTDGDTVGKIPLTVTTGGTYTPPAGKAYSVVEVDLGKPSAKDVNFRDYDGTITNSYSKEEFATLTAMPANPTHEGLTAQGWNWSLADAKAYVAECGRLEIGQMYITDDGKTRIYIHLEKGRTSPMLGVCLNGTVDVDWGDGTAHNTLTGTSTTTIKWTANHNYAESGDYVIKLTVTGEMAVYGADSITGLLRFSSLSDSRNYVYANSIQKVEFGSGITSLGDYAFLYCNSLNSISMPNSITKINVYAFGRCYNLTYITIPNMVTDIMGYAFYLNNRLNTLSIPNSVTNIDAHAFDDCHSLMTINIPNVTIIKEYTFRECNSLKIVSLSYGITTIDTYAFYSCESLESINIPNSVTYIGTYAFNGCKSLPSIRIPYSMTTLGNYSFGSCTNLKSVNIPNSITTIGANLFASCNCLMSIDIPNSVTTIGSNAFSSCQSLSSINIPESVTSIFANAFASCYGVGEYHFASTTPPTLSSTSVFTNIPADCIIYVPYSEDHSILEAYKTETNWSTYASYMQEEPV